MPTMKSRNLLKTTLPLVAVAALSAGSTHAALVAHLKLDETTGTTAVDSAGANNNGTLNNGPAWVTGTINGGLDFDGTNDYVNSPIAGIPIGNSQRTISIWFNADSVTTTDMKIFNYGDSGGTTGGPGQAFAFTVEDNKVFFRYSGGNSRYNLAGNTALSANAWYHLAAVVPTGATTSSDVLVYLNGSLANRTTLGAPQTLNTTPTTVGADTVPDFYLGHDFAGGAYFDGTLDDLQIYDTALNSTEIASLYNNPGSVIPEPSAALLGGLGALLLLRRRRA
jgi:hypothetical protein